MPPYAVELLENIKLVFDLKNFTFVMGIANDVIEGHLEHRYEKEFGIENGAHGKFYLEKIIQLPFHLPKFNKKFDGLVDSLFSKIDNGKNIDKVKKVIESISHHKRITPRLLVRIINQAKIHEQIDLVLCDDMNKKRENDDFMFATFVFILLLENLYKELFEIFQITRNSKFEFLKDLALEYNMIVEKNSKDEEKQIIEFLSKIEIDEKEEFSKIL